MRQHLMFEFPHGQTLLRFGPDWARRGSIRRVRIARWMTVIGLYLVLLYVVGSLVATLWLSR